MPKREIEMVVQRTEGRRIAARFAIRLIVAAVVAILSVKFFLLRLRVAFAAEQVSIFTSMKTSATTATSPGELKGLRDYCYNYYPSGTKQIAGSDLDKIVETVRSDALQFIDDRIVRSGGSVTSEHSVR
jgi:hypothetical protein